MYADTEEPVRCFTCGTVVSHLHEPYGRRLVNGEHPGEILDSLGLKRYCCRRMLLCQHLVRRWAEAPSMAPKEGADNETHSHHGGRSAG